MDLKATSKRKTSKGNSFFSKKIDHLANANKSIVKKDFMDRNLIEELLDSDNLHIKK